MSDRVMEKWGLLGVTGVQLLPPKAEEGTEKKARKTTAGSKKTFSKLDAWLGRSGCPLEQQWSLNASRVWAGAEMCYRLLPALFICF